MKQQDYLNLKRKIEKNFTKEQANVLLDIVNRISKQDKLIEANHTLIAANRNITALCEKNTDLKFSILAYRIKTAGVDIDISDFEVPEEEAKKEDE